MPPAKPRVPRVCQHCGRTFGILESRLKYGLGKHCSRVCQGLSHRKRVELRCQTCGKPFLTLRHDFTKARFCSRACVTRGLALPLPDRFWRHVQKRGPTECWPWKSVVDNSGYGVMMMSQPVRRLVIAHRVSYELHYGPIPAGLIIRHTCDARNCVNPLHLCVGTKAQNSQDMVSRKRHRIGEQHFNAVLTDARVQELRALYAAGTTIAALASKYHVGRSVIADAVHRRTWTHVPEDHGATLR